MAGIIFVYLIISSLIFGHELTRFLVARLLGFPTPVFGLGIPIGPYMVIANKWNTQFRIQVLLFGAYASIPLLNWQKQSKKDPSSSSSRQFSDFNVWQRLSIVLAGMGFYVAATWLLLFISVNIAGDPKTIVFVQGLSPRNHIAADAGIKVGDYIDTVDSKHFSTPKEIASYLSLHPTTSIKVCIQRKERFTDIYMTTNDTGKVGMSLLEGSPSNYEKVSVLDSFWIATQKLFTLGTSIVRETMEFLANRQTQPVSDDQRQTYGIVAMIKIGAVIIARDWRIFPWFLANLSMDLALINLIPFPGLAGNQLLAILLDALRESRLAKRIFPVENF